MSTNDPKQAQQAPSGLFGRLWGKGEVKRKAVKANLGEKNTLFYDEKLKRWRKEGEEISHAEMEPPPPPVLGSGFSVPAGGDSQGQRRAASRYADAGGFGKGTQNTAGSSFLPRPSTAPSVQAPFVPKQTAAAGAPKFFVPGGGAISSGTEPGNIAPSWGSFGQAADAADQGRSPGPSPASGHSTPMAQSPTPKSRPSPQSEPPLRRGRSPRQSEDEDDQLSWQQWRRQDEERREKKRQEAADLGGRVMDSFTETSHAGPVEGSVSNDADPSAAGSAEQHPEAPWPSGVSQEESVGDNMHREASGRSSASASFAAWNQGPRLGDEAPVTSPARPQPFAPIAEGPEGESRAQGDYEEAVDSFGGAVEFFGGNPLAEESSATLQDWNVGGELGEEELSAGPSPDIAGDAASGEQALPLEQTYGGLTWSQLQEWGEYYKQQGSSEDEVQEWVETCLANPDQYPRELTEDQAAGEAAAATVDDQAEGEHAAWQSKAAGEKRALENWGASGEASGDAEGYGEGVWTQGDAGLVVAEEPARNPADLMSQLREYVKAQRASDPSFGKLKSPLPWDGILTSDDDSPLTSPRLRLGSGRKKAVAEQPPTEKVVPSIPQIQEFVDTLSKTANNALGASWLDKIRQNLAEDQAAEQKHTAKAPEPAARSSDATPAASPGVQRPKAAKGVESQQHPPGGAASQRNSRSRSSTPKARTSTSILPQGSARPQLKAHVPGTSPSSQAGRDPAGNTPLQSGTPRNQQLFGSDVLSPGSSPRSASRSLLAASRTIHTAPDVRLQDGKDAPKSPFEAEERRANGGGSIDEPSISLAQWGGEDFVALENEEEVEQPWRAAGWDSSGSAQGLENGNRRAASGTQRTAPMQPGVVDELMEEAQKLPPLQIKRPTPQAAADPTPPVSTSKALVAEVEELRRQLVESQGEKDRLADEFTTLQDQNGKLEMELSDLKSSLDAQVAAAEDRGSSRALQKSESSRSAEIDARMAHLATATTEMEALRARLQEEQASLEEQREALEAERSALKEAGVSSGDRDSSWLDAERERLAAKEAELEEEANQVGAEREDLIQESERMLADREELEAEKEALAADTANLAADKSALACEKEALASVQVGLESERAALESKLEALSQQQDELRSREAAAQGGSAAAEAESVKQLREQLSSLQSQVEQLQTTSAAMALENEGLAEENLAKDEEIEQLTSQLVRVRTQLQSQEGTMAPVGMSAEEVKQLREQASLDFHRIAVLDQQNQELQERVDELEEAAGTAAGPELAAAIAERDEIKDKLGAAEREAEMLHNELSILRAEFESMSARSAEAAKLADAFEKERDSVAGQIAALTASRDSLAKENAQLKKRAARAEARAAKSAKAAEELEELRQKLAVAEEAAASGAEAVAENDSLASKLANANMKVAALEADVASTVESRDEASTERASLREQLSATQAASTKAIAEAEAERDRLATELEYAVLKVQSLEQARQDLEGLKQHILVLEQQLAAAEKESSEKQSQLDALSQKLSKLQRLQTQVDSISRERDGLLEKIGDMESELADAAELAKVSAAERDQLASEAADSSSEARCEAERLREELDALKSKLQAAKDRVSELEGQVAAASAGNGGAEERAAGLALRVRELEEENEEMFSRMSAMEEEADENLGKLHSAYEKLAAAERRMVEAEQKLQEKLSATSGDGVKLQAVECEAASLKTQLADLQQQLQGAQQAKVELEVRAATHEEGLSRTAARLQEVEQQLADSPLTAADARVAELQAEMAEREQDFTDLMVCLGQETAKVEALSERLQQQGIDVQSILDQVEESYGFGDEQPEEEVEDAKVGEPKMGGSAADLSWMDNPLEDAEGDWGV